VHSLSFGSLAVRTRPRFPSKRNECGSRRWHRHYHRNRLRARPRSAYAAGAPREGPRPDRWSTGSTGHANEVRSQVRGLLRVRSAKFSTALGGFRLIYRSATTPRLTSRSPRRRKASSIPARSSNGDGSVTRHRSRSRRRTLRACATLRARAPALVLARQGRRTGTRTAAAPGTPTSQARSSRLASLGGGGDDEVGQGRSPATVGEVPAEADGGHGE
jgi:hypothetical protein